MSDTKQQAAAPSQDESGPHATIASDGLLRCVHGVPVGSSSSASCTWWSVLNGDDPVSVWSVHGLYSHGVRGPLRWDPAERSVVGAADSDSHTPARDLGLCNGADLCDHGRAWNAECERCASGRLSELAALWGSERGFSASCRRSVHLVWPELGERLDDLLDQQDGGSADA